MTCVTVEDTACFLIVVVGGKVVTKPVPEPEPEPEGVVVTDTEEQALVAAEQPAVGHFTQTACHVFASRFDPQHLVSVVK